MSLIQGAKHGVRIIALPLTTPAPRAKPTHKSSEHLVYYHFVTPPPLPSKTNSWGNWITTKAADLWAGLGKAPEGTWKHRAFVYGERLIDRLDFEELALKSFDTSLGPKLIPTGHTNKLKPEDHPTIHLIYPPSACTSPLPHLRTLLEKRTPRHRNGCIMWVAISPLTAPLKLIPIIPNFPFFFCAWRAWSHYRAFKASQYLQTFLSQGAIHPQKSVELDAIYARYAPPDPASASSHQKSSPPVDLDPDTFVTLQFPGSPIPSASVSSSSSTDDHTHPPKSALSPSSSSTDRSRPRLLLTREAVPALERLLELPPGSSFAADVYRALDQVRIRLAGAQR